MNLSFADYGLLKVHFCCLDMALPLLQDAAIVFLVEVFVDWIKHAFITKLSELSASVSVL